MVRTVQHNEIVEPVLSVREAREVFDREVHRLMGISGTEFMERWESGDFAEIADEPGNHHIMRLALMMPYNSFKSN